MADQLDNNNGFDITPMGKKPGTYGVLYKSLSDVVKAFKKQFCESTSLFNFLVTNNVLGSRYIILHLSGFKKFSILDTPIDNNLSPNSVYETIDLFNYIRFVLYWMDKTSFIERVKSVIYLNNIVYFNLLKWGFEIETQDGMGIVGIIPKEFSRSLLDPSAGEIPSIAGTTLLLSASVGNKLRIDYRAYYNTLIGQWKSDPDDGMFTDDEMDLMMLRAQNQDEKPTKERIFGQKKINLDIG